MGEGSSPHLASGANLKLRIIAVFAAVTLVVAAIMWIVATRLLGELGLSPSLVASLRAQLLIWCTGVVVIAALFGVTTPLRVRVSCHSVKPLTPMP